MKNEDRIQPYAKNPWYWQYRSAPVLLLGGTVEDNVYQIPNIEEHLDLLASRGGNYVRCTMSCRDEGDVWWHEKDASGKSDLTKPGAEHWERFERFLDLAAERDIIAQFEMWDRFDFARDCWEVNPYNPKNNLNYSVEESQLPEVIDLHPGQKQNPFFRTPPTMEDNSLVLAHQQAHVDHMLSISLRYGNVLYCIDNETNEAPEWGKYWSDFIKQKAADAGALVMTTEMWDAHDLLSDTHLATIDHPETYDFVDVSQNNHQPPVQHWSNPQKVREHVAKSGKIRPINSVKIYGANTGSYGTSRDAQERFWRNIVGGLATTRFHRPPAGLGLSEIAQSHIQAGRTVTSGIDIFTCEPHNDLVSGRSYNEAYCTANPGVEYVIFFPDGGDVVLDVSDAKGKSLSIRWMDIRASSWAWDYKPVEAQDGVLRIATPTEDGYWTAVIKVD
jgi:hypothetical protein